MITKTKCPRCNENIALKIKHTTKYQINFTEDGAETKYQQQIQNHKITKKWRTNQLFKKILKKYKNKLKKGIKTTKLKKQLKNQQKLDKKTTKAFISKIKSKGVVEKNKKLKLPD